MTEKSKVINEHIYSLVHGIRQVALYTVCNDSDIQQIRDAGMDLYIQPLSNGYKNVFFGTKECLDVIRMMCNGRKLNELSDEEDFMLGMILGYDVVQQCRRYMKRKKKSEE